MLTGDIFFFVCEDLFIFLSCVRSSAYMCVHHVFVVPAEVRREHWSLELKSRVAGSEKCG